MTDVGVRRSHNQDNFAVHLASDESRWRQYGHLFLVADGMGGHAVGEKASEMASAIIPHTFEKHASEGAPTALRKAFLEANSSIHACGEQNSEFHGMGTTSTGLALLPEGAWLAHVGDSRAYRIRNGLIEQLTYDHSYVWEYARLKNIDPDDVKDFPSNVIHRCLGPQPLVQVDIEGPHPLQNGDIFLLCSDGLSGQVEDREIGVVASVLPPEEAARFLIDLANMRGGPDNITALIVRVTGGSTASSPSIAILPKRPPLILGLIPWPVLSLSVGTLLATTGIALHLAIQPVSSWGIVLFLLAIGPIVAGMGGLISEQRQRKLNQPEDEQQVPRVYRSRSCTLNKGLMDKIAKAASTFKQLAEEMKWESDFTTYEEHHEKAEHALKAGDLAGAFAEYCRAMRPLNATLHKHRSKEESFQPVWEKTR